MPLNDPVPSSAFDVAKRNASDLDNLLQQDTGTVETRTGKQLLPWQVAMQRYAAYNNTGAWATGTAYQVNDIWESSGTWYVVLTAYTSGATAGDDIASGNAQVWQVRDFVSGVDTIADLRALEPLFDGQQVVVSSYYDSPAPLASRGGGLFVYDSSDTTTPDNGVTVFVTTGGKRFRRIVRGSISAFDGGCRWDGISDDRDALQSIIDVVSASGGGKIFLPSGVAKFGDEVRVKEGVHLSGAGKYSTELAAIAGSSTMPRKNSRNVTTCPVLAILSDNVTLSGMSITGGVGVASPGQEEGAPLFVDGCENINIFDCKFSNGREYIVAVGSDNVVKNFRFYGNDVVVDRNTLQSSHYTNHLVLTNVTDGDVSGNYFSVFSGISAPMDVIGIINTENWGVGQTQNTNVSINNNSIRNDGPTVYGYQQYGGRLINHDVSNNRLYNCCLRLRGEVVSASVTNNKLVSVGSAIDQAIFIDGCYGVSNSPGLIDISNNQIVDCQKSGIFIENQTVLAGIIISVEGNMIQNFGILDDAAYYGIEWLSVDSTSGTVISNKIYDNTGSTNITGIRLYSTDNITVSQNRVQSYNGISFENVCTNMIVSSNYVNATIRYPSKSFSESTFKDEFDYTFSGTAAETVYSTSTRENGFLKVVSASTSNNNDHKYAGLVSFSRVGTASVSLSEFGETNGAALSWSGSSGDIQATRGNSAYSTKYKVLVDTYYG